MALLAGTLFLALRQQPVRLGRGPAVRMLGKAAESLLAAVPSVFRALLAGAIVVATEPRISLAVARSCRFEPAKPLPRLTASTIRRGAVAD